MKSVLISINPPHTNNIFDGKKCIEWRIKPMPTAKHYCYETKKAFGIGKVIGEYTVWRVKRYENISLIPEDFIISGCVPIEFLEAYSKGRPLYAHFIICPKRYKKPRSLHEFKKPIDVVEKYRDDDGYRICDGCGCATFENGHLVNCGDRLCEYRAINRPPQSWCYVEECEIL